MCGLVHIYLLKNTLTCYNRYQLITWLYFFEVIKKSKRTKVQTPLTNPPCLFPRNYIFHDSIFGDVVLIHIPFLSIRRFGMLFTTTTSFHLHVTTTTLHIDYGMVWMKQHHGQIEKEDRVGERRQRERVVVTCGGA